MSNEFRTRIEIETIKSQLVQSLSSANYRINGIQSQIWETISILQKDIGNSLFAELKLQFPDLAKFSLEAGQYETAILLGLDNLYDQGRANLLTRDLNAFQNTIGEIRGNLPPSEASLVTKALLIQKERMEGRAQISVKLLEEDGFLSHIQILPQEIKGEIYLQTASSYFNISNYSKALEHYRLAYETFELAARPGKMAISAFNSAVCAFQGDDRNALRTWLWQAEDILKTFKLPNLQLSFESFNIERLTSEKKYEEALQKCNQFLLNPSLSLVHKIIAHQEKTVCLMETGRLSEAEIEVSVCRHLISKNQLYQFESFQLINETNFETLITRKFSRGKLVNSPQSTMDRRAQIAYKLASARSSYFQNETDRAIKLYQDVAASAQANEVETQIQEDLKILSSMGSVTQLPKTARGFEMLILQLIRTRNISQLAHYLEQVERSGNLNPWQEVTLLIGKAFINLDFNKVISFEMAEKALHKSEQLGLERLTTLALGLSSLNDQHRQLQWYNHVNQMDSGLKSWFEGLFLQCLGRNIMSGQWIINSHEKKMVVNTTELTTRYDLVITESSGEVLFMNEKIDLSGQSVLLKLIVEIAKSQRDGLNKEELVQKVWAYEYNPIVHDSIIYTNIRRLRDLIPIELHMNRYRISSNIKWVFVPQEKNYDRMLALSERQKQILHLLKTSNRQISRGDTVRILKFSERTALRELTDLVNKNLLAKSGAGRSVKYTLIGEGVTNL